MAKPAYHILVVDDELSMRELLEYLLTKEGYQVTCAESGTRAIELLKGECYDLMICDIRLGDITGLEIQKPRYCGHHDLGLCHHRSGGGGYERRGL